MGKKLNNNLSDKNYEIYFKERESLIKAGNEQLSSFDKYLLTLSSGTFGLTVTYLKDLIKTIDKSTIFIIITAWSFLALTIALTIFSFILSFKAYEKQIKILEDYFLNNKTTVNYYSKVINIINYVSGSLFFVGIILILIFVSKNFN